MLAAGGGGEEGTGARRDVRVLVTGWFSFEEGEVTAGDLLARNTVLGWLKEAGIAFQTAVASSLRQPGEVELASIDPSRFSHLLFVCGPAAGAPVDELFHRFRSCCRIALGVSVVKGTSQLGPDLVFARDGRAGPLPDLALGAPTPPTPVVGVIRGHPQPEYEARHALEEAHRAVDRLLLESDVAPVNLDTWLHPGHPGLCSTPGQFESALRRMDAVVTTRLHGLVLSLKAGVPAVAVDPVRGGGKVSAQATALGWPAVSVAGEIDDERLAEHLAWCMSEEARTIARLQTVVGQLRLEQLAAEVISALRQVARVETREPNRGG